MDLESKFAKIKAGVGISLRVRLRMLEGGRYKQSEHEANPLLILPYALVVKNLMYNLANVDETRKTTFRMYNIALTDGSRHMCPTPKWAMPNS